MPISATCVWCCNEVPSQHKTRKRKYKLNYLTVILLCTPETNFKKESKKKRKNTGLRIGKGKNKTLVVCVQYRKLTQKKLQRIYRQIIE